MPTHIALGLLAILAMCIAEALLLAMLLPRKQRLPRYHRIKVRRTMRQGGWDYKYNLSTRSTIDKSKLRKEK